MLEGYFNKAVLLLILCTLLLIAGLLNRNLPGRYLYADNAVIDTRTGVIKFAPANVASGVPFEKIPLLRNQDTYVQTLRLYQDEAMNQEIKALEAQAKKLK